MKTNNPIRLLGNKIGKQGGLSYTSFFLPVLFECLGYILIGCAIGVIITMLVLILQYILLI